MQRRGDEVLTLTIPAGIPAKRDRGWRASLMCYGSWCGACMAGRPVHVHTHTHIDTDVFVWAWAWSCGHVGNFTC
jgi:hypothetical protein